MIKNPFNTFYYPSMKMNPNMTTVLTRRNRKTNKKSMEMSNLDATNKYHIIINKIAVLYLDLYMIW